MCKRVLIRDSKHNLALERPHIHINFLPLPKSGPFCSTGGGNIQFPKSPFRYGPGLEKGADRDHKIWKVELGAEVEKVGNRYTRRERFLIKNVMPSI